MTQDHFSASGKLLLFGEYLVLRGSKCLAVPLQAHQTLSITNLAEDILIWDCFEGDHQWLTIQFDSDLNIVSTSDEGKALITKHLLSLIKKEQPGLKFTGRRFKFYINFHRHYGFGTSATFISLLSQWSGVDKYFLLDHSFKGSGFDVAAATANGPVIYEMEERKVNSVEIKKDISNHLLFIYSGKKQYSHKEVNLFSSLQSSPAAIDEMNEIVIAATKCDDIKIFESLMQRSESLLSGILKSKPVKNLLFDDYPFSVKSLGAWGGDFLMATYRDENKAREYFISKGFNVIFNYQELVKA